MGEEFEESDVVFTGNNADGGDDFFKCHEQSDPDESRRAKRKKVEKKRMKPEAVNIPENLSWFHYTGLFEYEYEEEDGELVPPHVMVRRRVAGKMAFSVCSGMGRTLKGRDLSEVRNSVLRMTGFLET